MWTLICAALYLVVALASYSPADPGWSYVGQSESVANAGGRIGAWFADFALFLFGVLAYLLPLMVAWSAYLVFRQRAPEPETKLYWLALRWVGFLFLLTAGAALANLYAADLLTELPNGIGGGLGQFVTDYAVIAFGSGGGPLALTALFLVGFMLATGISPLQVVDALGAVTLAVFRAPIAALRALGRIRLPRFSRRRAEPDDGDDWVDDGSADAPDARDAGAGRFRAEDERDYDDDDELDIEPPPRTEVSRFVKPAAAARAPTPPEPPARKRAKPVDQRQLPLPRLAGDPGDRPPLELLDPPKKSARAVSPEQLETMSRELEARLAEFGVAAEVVAVHPGPVVALFELELAPGLKVSKITGLAKDIARALSKLLEVPNDQREMVYLSETLGSAAYREAKSPLTIAMGTDISGDPVVADLARMPHALIAGTTGSGKSVAINVMILSLVYKSSAEDVRLIMVDPKMLELSVYEGIPHLLTPVVTASADARGHCAALVRRRDGAPLQAHGRTRRAQHRRLQPQGGRGHRGRRTAARPAVPPRRRHGDDLRRRRPAGDSDPRQAPVHRRHHR